MSDAILQVFVFRDGEYVGSEVFANGEVTVGRSDTSDLILEDQMVAPSQAILTFDGQQATLLDLTQGDTTQVNQTPIRHSYVTQRDEIHLGPFTLKLKFMSRNGSSRGARASSIPAAAGLSQPSGLNLANDRAEQLTEIVQTHPPTANLVDSGVHLAQPSGRQRAVATHVVRHRDGEASSDLHPFGEAAEAIDPAATEAFDIGTSDVLSAADSPDMPKPRVFGSTNDGFNPANIESSSFEVMLDSAFLPSELTGAGEAEPDDDGRVARALYAVDDRSSGIERLPQPPLAEPSELPELATLGFDASGPSPLPEQPLPDDLADMDLAQADLPASSSPPAPSPNSVDVPASQPIRTACRRPEPQASSPPPSLPTGFPEDVDEELDEEERDAQERPGFKLVSQMTSAANLERCEPHHTAVEIVAFTGDDLRSAHVLTDPGEQYVLGRSVRGQRAPDAGHAGLRLIRLTAPGQAELEFSSAALGEIRKHGRSAQLDGLKKPEHASGSQGQRFRVALKTGMDARIRFGDVSFHVRFVRPPKTVAKIKANRIEPFFVRAVGGAIAAHLFLGMLLVLLGPETTFNSAGGEAYAEIIEQPPRDVEIEPPAPPPPPPEPELKPQPEPPAAEPPPKRRPKRKRRRVRRRRPPREQARGVTKQRVQTSGVLGAMGKLNLRAPGRRSMVQAASNLDAVKAPGGSNFRVGALVGKTPTSNVSVGGGGGGKPLTRGSASLLRGGFGKLAGRRNGTVRGKVRRVTARRLRATGSISREAIAKVINENLGQVQYCYERALIKKPGLKGKLVLEWRISTSGRVMAVRQKTSSIPSAEVATCIIRKLKTWRFPKPRGGVVVVSYPFIFSSVGF